MTTKDNNQLDEDEFAAFLQGQGEMARRLRDLPQPEPSAALDAAILARIEADLARGAARLPDVVRHAANDASMPGAAAGIRPGFMSRWRMPLAMAASMVLALLLLLRQPSQQNPVQVIVAQAPSAALPETQTTPPTPPSTPAAKPAAPTIAAKPPAASASKVASSPASVPHDTPAPENKGSDAAPDIQIAQADMPELRWRSVAPAPAATSTMPPPAAARTEAATTPAPVPAPMSAVDTETAKAWLALIDEMLKADLRQDALAEWEKFRKAYPHYPVPEKLAARIKALKK